MPNTYISYGYETILNPRSCCPYCGKESVESLGDNVKLFRNEFGSYRFVMYVKGRSVSALQIMAGKGTPTVANVITVKRYRRQGYAKKLWEVAKRLFPVINHSNHLSPEGLIFSERCR